MLKTKVKATAVTNLTDARYFAAWEVAWLGFNFNTGEDTYIPPQTMKAIKEWVDGVKIIGEFGLQPAEDIMAAVDLLELDAVQLDTFAATETLQFLHQQEVPVIKEMVLAEASELNQLEPQLQEQSTYVDYFLLNFDKNGIQWSSLHSQEIEQLKYLSERYPVLLSIGISGEEVLEMLDTVSIAGISVRGGEEEKVGFKSFDELDDIFEALEVLV
jgi:phosphoribosylanthranilate isomerase